MLDALARLTAREREVLERMAQGLTNASIAQALHVSQSAVEKHVNSLFDKLGLSHTNGYSRRVLAVLWVAYSKGNKSGVPSLTGSSTKTGIWRSVLRW